MSRSSTGSLSINVPYKLERRNYCCKTHLSWFDFSLDGIASGHISIAIAWLFTTSALASNRCFDKVKIFWAVPHESQIFNM